MSMLYDAADYHGHVDVGVAITGLEGAISYKAARSHGFHREVPYTAPTFTRTARVPPASYMRPTR